MTILLFIAGLLFLTAGAEMLVRGASRLAAALGISPLVIGLTVVAFGTSSPELAVSVKSAFAGQTGIALGNVVGSNIFNVLFILGLSAIIVPLSVDAQLIRRDAPLMVLLSVLVLVLALDQRIGRFDGTLLLLGLTMYITYLIRQSRRAGEAARGPATGGSETAKSGSGTWITNTALSVIGLFLLMLGSRWLVDSAVEFAGYLGVSELIIGLTIVSAGTSLPEVVTSVVAALRGERDIAVGNVVGSNVFNLMGVLGCTGLIAPGGIEVSAAVIGFDLPIMIAVALVCLPVFFTGGVISRQEGVFLLSYYVAYTAYLILAAADHDALPMFSAVMVYFVMPLTVAVAIVLTSQEIRRKRQRRVP